MKIPPSIKKGDKVGIICTARAIDLEKLDFALKTLKEWGLVPILGKTVGIRVDQFAGDDVTRATDLQNMINDPDIKAIICAKGGYGTVRIIDKVDFSYFKKNPKWLCGFSDVTALHAHFQQNFGIASLHSPLLSTFKRNCDEAVESMKQSLFGIKQEHYTGSHEKNRLGEVSGELVGGNLSVLFSLFGSESDLETKNKILFIEDLDEYLYHVDRMIVAFDRAGKFKDLKALVVGGMSKMNDNDIPFGKNPVEIISEHIEKYDFPVCFGFPCGHIEHNRALILGGEYNLSVKENGVNLVEE